MNILIVTSRQTDWEEFANTLVDGGEISVDWEGAGDSAINLAAKTKFSLVIVDEKLTDMTGLDMVRKLLQVNAMVDIVLASPLSSDEFHEVTEGLGLLGQLSTAPGKDDALKLIELIKASPWIS